jgi:hypothetical protein
MTEYACNGGLVSSTGIYCCTFSCSLYILFVAGNKEKYHKSYSDEFLQRMVSGVLVSHDHPWQYISLYKPVVVSAFRANIGEIAGLFPQAKKIHIGGLGWGWGVDTVPLITDLPLKSQATHVVY